MVKICKRLNLSFVFIAVLAVLLVACIVPFAFATSSQIAEGATTAAGNYITMTIHIDGVNPSFETVKSVQYIVNSSKASRTILDAILDTANGSDFTGGTNDKGIEKTWADLGVSNPTYCYRAEYTTSPGYVSWIVNMQDGRVYYARYKHTVGKNFAVLFSDDNRVDNTELPTIGDVTYNGASQNPKNLLPDKFTNADLFTVTGQSKTAVGSYSVGITPLAPVTWSDGTNDGKTVNFNIVAADINTCVVTEKTPKKYTGMPLSYLVGDFTVKLGSRTVPTTNYTVTLEETPKLPGTYAAIIEGVVNLTGRKEVQVTVAKADSLQSLNAQIHSDASYPFNPNGVKPEPTVTIGEDQLEAGIDFQYTYGANNSVGLQAGNVGIVTLASSEKLAQGLSMSSVFDILPKAVNELEYTFEKAVYTGSALTPTFTLYWMSDDERIELTDADYSIVENSWSNNINAGSATVSIQGQQNYAGTTTLTFAIEKAQLDDSGDFVFNIEIPEGGYKYDGYQKEPVVTVTYLNLDVSNQFGITYQDNVAAGEAHVVISPSTVGNFVGEPITHSFNIAKAKAEDFEYVLSYGESMNAVLATALPLSEFSYPGFGRHIYTLIGADGFGLTINPQSGLIEAPNVGKIGSFKVRMHIEGDDNVDADSYIECDFATVFDYGFHIDGNSDVVYATLSAALSAIDDDVKILVKGNSDELSLGADIAIDGNVELEKATDETASIEFGEYALTVHGNLTVGAVIFNITQIAVPMLADERAAVTVDGGTLTMKDGSGVYGSIYGAVRAVNNANVALNGADFENNSAQYGGAIYIATGSSLTVNGASFRRNTASADGGAIYIAPDVSVNLLNAEFESNTAVRGGAIYFTGRAETEDKLTLGSPENDSAASFMSNASTGDGGAIYIEDHAEVYVKRAVADNNVSEGIGDFIYLAGAHSRLEVEANEATVGITDSIGIGAKAVDDFVPIKLLGSQMQYRINLTFADEITAEVTKGKPGGIYVQSDTLTAQIMLQGLRVVNGGYMLISEGTNKLRLSVSVEMIAFTDSFIGYPTIQEAVLQSNGAVYIAINVKAASAITLTEAIEESQATVISDQMDITFKTAIYVTENSGNTALYTIENGEWQLRSGEAYSGDIGQIKSAVVEQYPDAAVKVFRGNDYNGELLRIEKGGKLTLENVIYDGGAIWEGGKIELSDERGEVGTVTSNNSGIVAHTPLVINRGVFTMKDGSALQNNDNNYAAPGEGYSNYNYGGGLRNEGSGEFFMYGGSIRYNYSREGGGILNINRHYASAQDKTDGVPYAQYVDGGNPTATIDGGEIYGNAAQRTGSAIEAAYGGATVIIKGSANIYDNFALHDRGSIVVQEGAEIEIQGGSIAPVAGNDIAIVVYDRYSEAAINQPYTPTYLDGDKQAQLILSGAPTIDGNIYIDEDCAVYDPAFPDALEHANFAPYIELKNYSGSALTLDIDPQRGFGKVMQASEGQLCDYTINSRPQANVKFDLSARFIYSDGSRTTLYLSGYDINVNQDTFEELRLRGVVHPTNDIQLTLRLFGSLSGIDLQLDEDGNIGGGYGLSLNIESESMIPIEANVSPKNGAKIDGVASSSYNAYFLHVNKSTGYVTVPDGYSIRYLAKDGNKSQALANGILPNDILISEDGFVTLYYEDEEVNLHIGVRENAPTLDVDFGSELIDFYDTSITVRAIGGFEYALLIKDGDEFAFVRSDATWRKASDGKVTFEGLTAGMQYFVTTRRASTSQKLPSEYIEADTDLVAITTLSALQASQKIEFERKYAENKSKMIVWNDDKFEISITYAELKAIYALLAGGDGKEALPESVAQLATIAAMDLHIKDSIIYADAGEWKHNNAVAIALDIRDEELDAGEDIVAQALTSYHEIADNDELNLSAADIKLQIKSEYDELIEKYKRIAEHKVDGALRPDCSYEALTIADTYKRLFAPIVDTYDTDVAVTSDANFMPAKEQIDRVWARASAALTLQQSYDEIIKLYGEQTFEDAKDNAAARLTVALNGISAAQANEANGLMRQAAEDIYIEVAKGIVELSYRTILTTAGDNGILLDYLEHDGDDRVVWFATARDEAYSNIESASAENAIERANEGVLALAKAEGKAMIECYLTHRDLRSDSSMITDPDILITDSLEVVSIARTWQSNIDGMQDKAGVSSAVASAKLDIEKARAKEYISAAYNELNSNGTETASEYGKGVYEDNLSKIASSADAHEAWKRAEYGKQRIVIEVALGTWTENISGDREPLKGEKTDIINKYILQARVALDTASNGFKPSDLLEDTKLMAQTVFATATDEKLQLMYAELADYDRLRFIEDFSEYVGESSKPLDEIKFEDLDNINAALADLAATYSPQTQILLDDLRHELLNKKRKAIADRLTSLYDQYNDREAVMNALRSIGAQLDNITVPEGVHGNEEDDSVNAALTALVDNIRDSVNFEDYKLTQLEKLKAFALPDDSALTISVLEEALTRITQLSFSNSLSLDTQKADIDAMTVKGMADMYLRRFRDKYPVIEYGGTSAELQEAVAALENIEATMRNENIDENVIALVMSIMDNEAQGYEDYADMFDDRRCSVTFDETKQKLVDKYTAALRDKDADRVRGIYEAGLDELLLMTYQRQSADGREAYLAQMLIDVQRQYDDSIKQLTHAQNIQDAEERIADKLRQRKESGYLNLAQRERLDDIYEQAIIDLRGVQATDEDPTDKLAQIVDEAMREIDRVGASASQNGHLKPDGEPVNGSYLADDPNELWGMVTTEDGLIPYGTQLRSSKIKDADFKTVEKLIAGGKLRVAQGSDISDEQLAALLAGKRVLEALDIYLEFNGSAYDPESGLYKVMILLPSKLLDTDGLQIVHATEDGTLEVYDTSVEYVSGYAYLVFETTHFSTFYVLGETKDEAKIWPVALLGTIVAIELAALIALVILFIRFKKHGYRTYGFIPFTLIGAVSVAAAKSATVALGVIAAILFVGIAVMTCLVVKLKKSDQKTDEGVEREQKNN